MSYSVRGAAIRSQSSNVGRVVFGFGGKLAPYELDFVNGKLDSARQALGTDIIHGARGVLRWQLGLDEARDTIGKLQRAEHLGERWTNVSELSAILPIT